MYNMYPPPYGYGQPTPDDFQRGLKLALKMREREEKKEIRKKEMETKKKETEKKAAEEARNRTLTSVEWFIFGIIAYPFIGPLYNYALHNAQGLVK